MKTFFPTKPEWKLMMAQKLLAVHHSLETLGLANTISKKLRDRGWELLCECSSEPGGRPANVKF